MNHNPSERIRTVRELGGEIWAEVSGPLAERGVDYCTVNVFIDLSMRVLARHIGSVITQDSELPVEPLAPTSDATKSSRGA